jgi:hypothetical protein
MNIENPEMQHQTKYLFTAAFDSAGLKSQFNVLHQTIRITYDVRLNILRLEILAVY